MAKSVLRGRDMNVEREIAKFLDKHLYSQKIFTQSNRTDDIDSQLHGSDIIISIPTKGLNNVIVDEKAQTQYINKPLPTFSLELSFIASDGKIIEGWLTDKEKVTEYYLFQWIHKSDSDWNIKSEDIKKIEYALVSRGSILDYLASHGYSVEELKKKDAEIRAKNQKGQHDKSEGKDFWFFHSTNLAESPINIVLRKKVLLELATISGIIEV
ncbi:hypothetical protein H6A37_12795 [Phocaeicola plebeius]|uniref:hypothetical protein n=1 Tax=Bacteroidaceae TaxID=815 RepID=UPI000D0BB7B4|nr:MULTISPECIES: hypothetical protein [Bacteroidaceae]MBM6964682.1 hypothetical protein [Phocaeicola plebeius]